MAANSRMNHLDDLSFPPLCNASLNAGSPPQARGRVLVVEDNPINQRVAVILVNKMGFTADVANDGSEALNLINGNDYELILMDCQMPVMDGFEATRAIRSLDRPIAKVPIIAVTANVMEGQRDKCLEAGMNDYLPKPINRELLSKTIEKWAPKKGPQSAETPNTPTITALTA